MVSKQFRQSQDLSGGQWQRISVAGIYRDAAILNADEPTTALDAKPEARAGIQHATTISSPCNGDGTKRTTVLVTHRLANIAAAERILVLDGNRLSETGTHTPSSWPDTGSTTRCTHCKHTPIRCSIRVAMSPELGIHLPLCRERRETDDCRQNCTVQFVKRLPLHGVEVSRPCTDLVLACCVSRDAQSHPDERRSPMVYDH